MRISDGFQTSRGGCLTRILLLSVAVIVGAWLLPGVTVDSLWAVILTALVISILDNIVRPILLVISLPVIAISLGLFLFVINALIIVFASNIVNGFHVDTFWHALLFSFVLTLLNYLIELPVQKENRKELHRKDDDNTDDDGFTPYEEIKD